MNNLNLILKFKLAGDRQFHVKSAARIRVDGNGGLVLYDAQSGAVETIKLRTLRSLSIRHININPAPLRFAALAVA